MARVMKQTVTILATGAFTTILAPPAGHKYELLCLACSEHTGIAMRWIPSLNYLGLVQLQADDFGVAAGVNGNYRNFQSFVVFNPSTFDVGQVAAAPGFGVAVATYMDVDL